MNSRWTSQRFKKKQRNLGGIFDIDSKAQHMKTLELKSQDPNLWKDHQKQNALIREKTELEKIIKEWQSLSHATQDALVLAELLQQEPDDPAIQDLKKESQKLAKQLKALELKSFLNGQQDKNNCYMAIHAGAGGTEAEDWAGILQRMYFKWAEQKQFSVTILSEHSADVAGLRSAQFLIKGPFAYGYLKAETGVHRLVRISPFDANARRHTSFASVFIYPEVDDSINIIIKEEDLKTDTYRASGAGGQHINKTDSAIRMTHLPTGIVVQCQNQRSQHANRQQAMKMLQSALYEKELTLKKKQKAELESSKKANEWGSQIRSYVLHPYRLVKDHRTGWESHDPSAVLNGELDPFISAFLTNQKSD